MALASPLAQMWLMVTKVRKPFIIPLWPFRDQKLFPGYDPTSHFQPRVSIHFAFQWQDACVQSLWLHYLSTTSFSIKRSPSLFVFFHFSQPFRFQCASLEPQKPAHVVLLVPRKIESVHGSVQLAGLCKLSLLWFISPQSSLTLSLFLLLQTSTTFPFLSNWTKNQTIRRR